MKQYRNSTIKWCEVVRSGRVFPEWSVAYVYWGISTFIRQ